MDSLNSAVTSVRTAAEFSFQEGDLKHRCLLVKDFFPAGFAQDVLKLFRSSSGNVWVPQENNCRFRLEESKNPLLNELREFFYQPSLMAALEEILQRKLKPAGVTLWKDTAGYRIDMHTDLPALNCAIQIYITDSDDPFLGTSMADSEHRVMLTLPYRHNFGYLLLTANQTPHALLNPVPAGRERYSVYARYLFD